MYSRQSAAQQTGLVRVPEKISRGPASAVVRMHSFPCSVDLNIFRRSGLDIFRRSVPEVLAKVEVSNFTFYGLLYAYMRGGVVTGRSRPTCTAAITIEFALSRRPLRLNGTACTIAGAGAFTTKAATTKAPGIRADALRTIAKRAHACTGRAESAQIALGHQYGFQAEIGAPARIEPCRLITSTTALVMHGSAPTRP